MGQNGWRVQTGRHLWVAAGRVGDVESVCCRSRCVVSLGGVASLARRICVENLDEFLCCVAVGVRRPEHPFGGALGVWGPGATWGLMGACGAVAANGAGRGPGVPRQR